MFENLINEKKLVDLFLELTAIDSVSFKERKLADALKQKLTGLGIEAFEDDAAKVYHSQAGNVYASLKGDIEAPTLLFSAHMDTVEPGIHKEPVVDDGRIYSKGNTVLGADDIGGVSVILEAVRILRENHIPHRSIELLFPIAEEAYVKGSRVFDFSQLEAKEAYVLDLTGDVGTASLREPTLISFQVEITGKSAHAGFAPEKGINAIQIFADAVNRLTLGRIDSETTVNIGTISGGTVTNAIPEKVIAAGEIRSFVHEKALDQIDIIKAAFSEAAKKYGGRVLVTEEINLVAYKVSETDLVAERFKQACEEIGIPVHFTETFGGSDNNSFLRNGISGIVLASAMEQVHTVEEYCDIKELVRCLQLVLCLMTSEK